MRERPSDHDKEFYDAALRVVIDWVEFAKTASRDEALDRLAERAPDVDPAERAHALDAIAAAYPVAVEAVRRNVLPTRRRLLLWAAASSPRDIDHPPCMAELDRVAPDLAPYAKKQLLDWVIHWHYVR